MSTSTWVIISWVFVALFTALNVFIFLKLKSASDQMMKMAFPGAKNMQDAMAQAQKMMAGMGAAGSRGPSPRGGRPMPAGKPNDAQLKAAMAMLQNMQKGGKP